MPTINRPMNIQPETVCKIEHYQNPSGHSRKLTTALMKAEQRVEKKFTEMERQLEKRFKQEKLDLEKNLRLEKQSNPSSYSARLSELARNQAEQRAELWKDKEDALVSARDEVLNKFNEAKEDYNVKLGNDKKVEECVEGHQQPIESGKGYKSHQALKELMKGHSSIK